MFFNHLNVHQHSVRCLLFFVFILLINLMATGQSSIRGKVTAQDNGEAVAGASIYISNTTIGTASNGEGFFNLTNTPTVPFVLNISSIGFQTKVISVNPSQDSVLNITLVANVQQLKEVVITPEKNDLWANFGQKFLSDLIGYSQFSQQCKIKNLQSIVLDFDREKQVLSAFCREPLIIVNKALGYQISYWLEGYQYSFKSNRTFIAGYPFFKDLSGPKTRKRKARRYAKNRAKSYRGSLTHFIQALYANQLPQAGFRVDVMQRVKISDAYKDKSKEIDTLFYNDVNIQKIQAALKTRTPNEAIAQRYLQSVKNWYLNNVMGKLRLRLGRTNVVSSVYEFDRDPSNAEKIIVSNYKSDPSLEQRSRQGRVNMIVAQNIDASRFVQNATKSTKKLQFNHFLYVTYRKEIEEPAYQKAMFPFKDFVRKKQTSIISIPHQAHIIIHPNGYFYPPGNILVEGYWAFEKVDKLLPLNYKPEK